MSTCCSGSGHDNTRHIRSECPINGNMYRQVSSDTILHHLDKPWLHPLDEQTYFFCDDPECEVVYFAENKTIIKKSQLRTRVGIKEQDDNALLCYCFDVSRLEARTADTARNFVIQQTRRSACSCLTSNPSGRCCLKDFPKGK